MNRADLVKTLELVKPALATNNMVPIFQCFNFINGTVSAYDDTIAIVGPTEFGGTCGLYGSTLLGLLSNTKVDDVELEFGGAKSTDVTLRMGKAISKLPFQPEENFIFKQPDDKWSTQITFNESLANALKICLETVSADATQAALHGISIMGDRLYSCNGDSLTRHQIKQSIKGRALLSTPFCEAVLRLWSSLPLKKGTLYFSPDWVLASFDDWSVYGRVLEINDPIDFEELIKRNLKKQPPTQQVPNGFGEALLRARVLAEPESTKTVATVSKGKISLFTETHMGEVKDVLPYGGNPDVVANINSLHIYKAISTCDQMAILENCVLLERLPDVLLLVSNMS